MSVGSQHNAHHSSSVSYSGVLLSFYNEQVYEGNVRWDWSIVAAFKLQGDLWFFRQLRGELSQYI